MNPEPKKPTLEESLKMDMAKMEKAHREQLESMAEKYNELVGLITQQQLYETEIEDYDFHIDHVCHNCNAISMGQFTPEQQEKFIKAKAQYPANKGTRSIIFQHAIRQLYLESIQCKVDNCPFTKGDTFLVDDYKKVRKNHEGAVELRMTKNKKNKFKYPTLGLPRKG